MNTGSQDKDRAAKNVAPVKPAVAVPAAAQGARREIRTVLVATHGWPTDAAAAIKRRGKR